MLGPLPQGWGLMKKQELQRLEELLAEAGPLTLPVVLVQPQEGEAASVWIGEAKTLSANPLSPSPQLANAVRTEMEAAIEEARGKGEPVAFTWYDERLALLLKLASELVQRTKERDDLKRRFAVLEAAYERNNPPCQCTWRPY